MIGEDQSRAPPTLSSMSGRLSVALALEFGSPPGGDAVAGIGVAFGDVQLRLVGDVANGTGLGAAAEQRALRAFEHFDALHVDQVDVVVARRELHRLVVEVQATFGNGAVVDCDWLPEPPELKPRMKMLPVPGPLPLKVTLGVYFSRSLKD